MLYNIYKNYYKEVIYFTIIINLKNYYNIFKLKNFSLKL